MYVRSSILLRSKLGLTRTSRLPGADVTCNTYNCRDSCLGHTRSHIGRRPLLVLVLLPHLPPPNRSFIRSPIFLRVSRNNSMSVTGSSDPWDYPPSVRLPARSLSVKPVSIPLTDFSICIDSLMGYYAEQYTKATCHESTACFRER